MKNTIITFLRSGCYLMLIVMVWLASTPAYASLSRRSVLVYDVTTNRVLYEKDGYAKRYPASLTKMMTLYMLFDALSTGKVNFNTRMTASRYAASQPQTNLAMRTGDTITVSQAINAMVIRSANDVAVVIAEHLGGNTANFAGMMTRKARALGMKNTVFKNPNGLPDARQYTTALDLALLGVALRKHFPQYYHVFSNLSFSYKGRVYVTHNRVLNKMPGIDGIKTGYINASGFNLVTSLKYGGINIVAVIMGGNTAAERDAQMVALMKRTYTTMLAQRKAGDGANAVAVAQVDAPIPIAKPALLNVNALDSGSEIPKLVAKPADIEAPASPAPSTLKTTPPPPIAIRFSNTATPQQGNTAHLDVSLDGTIAKKTVPVDKHTLEYQYNAAQNSVNETASAPSQETPIGEVPITNTIPPVRAVSTPVNNWAVQIGVYRDKASAHHALTKVAKKVRPELSAAVADVEYAQQDNRGFHRARFKNLGRDEATNACLKLQRLHQDCFVARMN